jgi:hypothetical protein
MCSKLLCEFATQNNEQLIISYAEVHNLTNPKIAWSDMKSCENVYCMHSKDVHFISVDLPLTDIKCTSFEITPCYFGVSQIVYFSIGNN